MMILSKWTDGNNFRERKKVTTTSKGSGGRMTRREEIGLPFYGRRVIGLAYVPDI